jgi:two-component system OmpR family response regulator
MPTARFPRAAPAYTRPAYNDETLPMTTFLPREPVPAADGAAAARHSRVRDVSRRILLVDDDEYIGAAVCLFLQRRGEIVIHCASAHEARRWLADQRCDLVITDILMPDSDGLEFIQWFRALDKSTQIIAISGTDSWGHSYLHAAAQLGASRVLPKPFELSALADLVDELLGRRK